MTAMKMPNVELPTIELPDVELPSIHDVSERAADTVDRLLRRERRPIWPWVLLSIVLIGLLASIGGFLTWNRRSTDMPIADPAPADREDI